MTETLPPAFLSDERFIKEHRKVFVMFMGRDGYPEQMSTEESLACSRPDPASLSTAAKMEIAEIYHKAGEHAYFGYCVAFGIQPE